MVHIKVSSQALSEYAQNLETEIGLIDADIKAIGQIIKNMPRYWRGDANTKHGTDSDEMITVGNNLIAELQKAPVDMLTIAGLYEAESDNITLEVQTLPTDII